MPDDARKNPIPATDATEGPVPDVAPPGATRQRVRVDRDGKARLDGKTLQFGRTLAGALVTVEG